MYVGGAGWEIKETNLPLGVVKKIINQRSITTAVLSVVQMQLFHCVVLI